MVPGLLRGEPPQMIKRLDNAITELRRYRADISRHRWRTDVQERIATLDIIETIIKNHLYSTMPEQDDPTTNS